LTDPQQDKSKYFSKQLETPFWNPIKVKNY
jgi:hypothetical protein